jgi:hypothetical protein
MKVSSPKWRSDMPLSHRKTEKKILSSWRTSALRELSLQFITILSIEKAILVVTHGAS